MQLVKYTGSLSRTDLLDHLSKIFCNYSDGGPVWSLIL